MEGTAIYHVSKTGGTTPTIGATHPYDNRLRCISVDLTYGASQIVAVTNYMGLLRSPTRAIINWPGATGQDPIETHPAFVEATSDFPEPLAGTISAAWNGALFVRPDAADETTADAGSGEVDSYAEFRGFYDPTNKMFGTTSYLVANPIIYLSYWSTDPPSLAQQMTIVDSIPGVQQPPDVVNWLFLTPQYREIAGGMFYQVTETYMGSGPNGINDYIYKDGDATPGGVAPGGGISGFDAFFGSGE
jgi:hypothetical protein